MVTRTDYSGDAVTAARAVLLEVVRVLGEYRADIVLIGGWVPELLLPGAAEPHVGSLDVDLALDHRQFGGDGYETVHELLVAAKYERDQAQPFIYRRTVQTGDAPIRVQVDILAGSTTGRRGATGLSGCPLPARRPCPASCVVTAWRTSTTVGYCASHSFPHNESESRPAWPGWRVRETRAASFIK
jgi:hypothetical protein